MKPIQKAIAISTLAFEAWFMHVLFCNWKGGFMHESLARQSSESSPDVTGLIASLGPVGVYARRSTTFEFDATLGIAVPVAFGAMALFICTLKVAERKLPVNSK